MKTFESLRKSAIKAQGLLVSNIFFPVTVIRKQRSGRCFKWFISI